MSGNGTVTIELDVFYAVPPKYTLIGKYTVQYLVLEDDGNTKDFKTITTQPVEKVQLRLGFFDRLKRAKEFSLARLFDRNLI